MYLVMMLAHNRVNHIKAFESWDMATAHANELVTDLRGVSAKLPDWENGPYRNVYEYNHVAIMIEPTDVPIRDRGVVSVSRAYADAERMRQAAR